MRVVTGVVAVLTFRRPQGLLRLLAPLLEQVAELNRTDGATLHRFDVLVVDNDQTGSARDTVESFLGDEVGLRYVVEPVAGIAAARNRALREAGDADVLVFIDDDECPHPRWLDHLVRTWVRTGVAAVAGAVESEFDGPLDPWIADSRFFLRTPPPSGTQVPVAGAGNLLLDLRQVSRLGVEFDERFGLSGGEDNLFTRQLTEAGGVILRCNEAVVADYVPRERMTRAWVLRRSIATGNGDSRVQLATAGGPAERRRRRLGALASGCLRLAFGSARFGIGVVRRSQPDRARGLRTAAKGLGRLGGAFGRSSLQYRR